MNHLHPRVLICGSALALMVGCGSSKNAVDNPFRDFQIDDELASAIYTYRFPSSTIDMQYFPDRAEVLGISTSDDHTMVIGFHGPKIDAKNFSISDAETDANNNGNFFDDPALPVTGNSTGTFSSTGNELTLDMTVLVGVVPVQISGTGSLSSTRPIGG